MTIEKIKLPKGRIVGGHPLKPEKKLNFQTKQPVVGSDGAHVLQWRVEYAIPKSIFLSEVWPLMVKEAASAYPVGADGMPQVGRDFSWKMQDGDDPSCPKGSKIPYNAREGYPGHYILTLKTEAFCPGCWKFQNGGFYEVSENEVKVGDYLVANVDIRIHTNNDGGLYINPNIFELVEIGQPISTSSAVNPELLLGPNGNSTQQGGFAAPVALGMPQGLPASAYQQGGFAAPVALGMPQGLPAPAYDIIQNLGNAPVVNAPPNPLTSPQAVSPTATSVTGYPTNPAIPGLPQAR